MRNEFNSTLRKVRDGQTFKLTKYGAVYEMVKKEKSQALISSIISGRTYKKPLKTKCRI